jgi:hypothetical protein
MKKLNVGLIFLSTLLMVGCTPSQKTLYSWGNYQQGAYNYVKNSTDASLDDLLKSYEEIISKQNGTRKTIPPGICADYGYLLVKKGKKEEGIAMMKKEGALYPESAVFMSRIIKKIENEND